MTNIGKLWAGRAYGTNTGNLFIEFTQLNPNILGVLRFNDDNFGIVVYEISGEFSDKLKITGKPKPEQFLQNLSLGDFKAEAELTPQGSLLGKWETEIGTGGAFELLPHDSIPVGQNKENMTTKIPEQIHTKRIELGSLRLFAEDIRKLFEQVKQDFLTGRLIVTYNTNNSDVTKYADAFLNENPENLEEISYLKLNIQELEAHGINRITVVELRKHGLNEVRVEGIHESWVIGNAERLAGFLKKYESIPITKYKKFGLNINQIIFWIMLVMMPSLVSWRERACFALIVVLILYLLFWLNTKYIPDAALSMNKKSPGWLSRNWPQVISWIIAIVGIGSASWIYSLIKNGF